MSNYALSNLPFFGKADMAINVTPTEFWETFATIGDHTLGQRYADTLGRIWRFAKFAADLTRGHLVQTAAPSDITTNYAVTNTAAVVYQGRTYAIKQAITPVTSPAWTPGAYAGLFGTVSDGTGVGQSFRIRDNSATTLYLEDALTTALTAAQVDEIIIMAAHNYESLVASTTALGIDGPAIGSVQCAVDYSEKPYGWILTRGVGFGVLDTSASCAIGSPLSPSSATAGQLIRSTFTTTAPENVVAKLRILIDETVTNKEAIVDYCFE